MKVKLSERKSGFDYPRRKQHGEVQDGKNNQKNRAMTSSYLTFLADPGIETTVSPDILAPMPRTRVEPNQHNKAAVSMRIEKSSLKQQ